MTERYTEEDWVDIDPLLVNIPIPELAAWDQIPMSVFTLYRRCRKLGIEPYTRPRINQKKRLKTKEIDRLLRSFGGGVFRV